jgi:hypothetical protein
MRVFVASSQLGWTSMGAAALARFQYPTLDDAQRCSRLARLVHIDSDGR